MFELFKTLGIENLQLQLRRTPDLNPIDSAEICHINGFRNIKLALILLQNFDLKFLRHRPIYPKRNLFLKLFKLLKLLKHEEELSNSYWCHVNNNKINYIYMIRDVIIKKVLNKHQLSDSFACRVVAIIKATY